MDDRKKVVEAFLNNEESDRVVTAFWHHFVSFHNHYNGDVKEIYDEILTKQKKYIDEVKPDLLKIMSDGFFGHPSVCSKVITTLDELREVKSVGANHNWINRQVEYVKEVADYAGDNVYKYYNIFSPLQYIRLRFEEYDEDFKKFTGLFKEEKDYLKKPLLMAYIIVYNVYRIRVLQRKYTKSWLNRLIWKFLII